MLVRQTRQDRGAGRREERRQTAANGDVHVDQVMARKARDEHNFVAVQFLQVSGFAQRAANVQQIGRGLVDQLVGAHIVVRKLQHLGRQPVVARVGNAAQVAQRFQRVDQALRGAAVRPDARAMSASVMWRRDPSNACSTWKAFSVDPTNSDDRVAPGACDSCVSLSIFVLGTGNSLFSSGDGHARRTRCGCCRPGIAYSSRRSAFALCALRTAVEIIVVQLFIADID